MIWIHIFELFCIENIHSNLEIIADERRDHADVSYTEDYVAAISSVHAD